MTISSIGPAAASGVTRPHHHHRPDAGISTDGPGDTGPGGAATPQAGAARFASALQSILVNAQSGQPSGQTANDPAATADTGAGQSGGAKRAADQLQNLLGDSNGTPAAAGPAGNTLQEILTRLQATLQQTLANYKAAAPAPPGTSVTV